MIDLFDFYRLLPLLADFYNFVNFYVFESRDFCGFSAAHVHLFVFMCCFQSSKIERINFSVQASAKKVSNVCLQIIYLAFIN